MPEPDLPTPEEMIAAARAQFDQMVAGMAETARALISFREELIKGGVGPESADRMTADYFALLIRPPVV